MSNEEERPVVFRAKHKIRDEAIRRWSKHFQDNLIYKEIPPSYEDDQWMSLRTENSVLKSQLQDLQSHVSSSKLEIAKKQVKNDCLNSQLEQKAHELEEARSRIKTLLSSAKELKILYDNTTTKLQSVNVSESGGFIQKFYLEASSNNEYEQNIINLNEKIQTLEKELRLSVAKSTADLEKYNFKISDAEHKIELLNSQLERGDRDIATIKSPTLNNDLEQKEVNHENFNTKFTNDEVECLYKQLKGQFVYIKELEEKNKSLLSENQHLKDYARSAKILEEKCTSLEKDLKLVRKLKHHNQNMVEEAKIMYYNRELEARILALHPFKNINETTAEEVISSIEEERIKYAKIVMEKNSIGIERKIKELEIEFLNSELQEQKKVHLASREQYEEMKRTLLKTKKLMEMLLEEAKNSENTQSSDPNGELNASLGPSTNNNNLNKKTLLMTLSAELDSLKLCLAEGNTQDSPPDTINFSPLNKLEVETKKYLDFFVEESQKLLQDALSERDKAKMEVAKLQLKVSELDSKLSIFENIDD